MKIPKYLPFYQMLDSMPIPFFTLGTKNHGIEEDIYLLLITK